MEAMITAAFARSARRPVRLTIGAVLAAGLLTGCGSADDEGAQVTGTATMEEGARQPEQLKATVIAEHPWDATSFTQGVEVVDEGKILVGTGRNGESRIYHSTVDGEQSDSHDLERRYFGEGVTRHVGKDGHATVWQLTWKENTAFRRDANTLEELDQVHYDGEGWGICSTGEQLVVSDGSGTLTFRDPESFAATGSVDVTRGGEPTTMLNELDCRDNEVWANVWQSDEIYRIDPTTGEVTGVVDMTGLVPTARQAGVDVLNGIAHVPGTDRFYLTGKLWDTMYEVTFEPA
ncbi:glutaminyl-peptide cyclotransferase [Corynebacterium sp. MSK039]|uniref:glutaminyl-peptide cyclotransferase n=1 Tax=Corynebacterium sp. MSK039 TaxID=3050193 RepID=UPI00254ED3A5|nr:glutaminyl-peptide cyclotransferase [Corynebacterium sp. MSK039]MDK8791771.1 glutaminyl-peptide cyclotransferase [Corynebacterium sp. MSK039]